MRPRRVITPDDTAVIFDDAVRERALVLLSLQDHSAWRSFKARFLERDPAGHYFVLDYNSVNGANLPELFPGQCVGVSFRHHNRKVLFASVVEARGHFMVEDHTSISAVRYRWPESLIELQRRSYYRTPIPENMNLLVSMWTGGPAARNSAQSSTLEVVNGTLVDLSCGGALVRINQAEPLDWHDDETLGVELQLSDGKAPLLLSAYARGVRHDELGQLCVAIQFIGLELSLEGRLALQRVAGFVQKLHRRGISSGSQGWNRRYER